VHNSYHLCGSFPLKDVQIVNKASHFKTNQRYWQYIANSGWDKSNTVGCSNEDLISPRSAQTVQ